MELKKYNLFVLKNRIENILIYPFILLGRFVASLNKNKREYTTYYFFPFYHIGGAEKVHYQIIQATASKDSIIYFTRKSKGRHFIHEFEKAGCVIKDISSFTDNKWIFPLNLIFRGIISYQINTQKVKPLVFNGQSNFGYKLSPWVRNDVPQIDLIHAFNTFSEIRVPFLRFYKKSITISREIVDKHRKLYLSYQMPLSLINNLEYISFGIQLPPRKEKAILPGHLRVLYVGRGSPEKRIHLIALMAQRIAETTKNITFSFAGDVERFIPAELHSYCHFLGVIHDEKQMQDVYEQHDVLMVTSSTESGPLVVLEAMIKGLAVISTAVGIVPDHISVGKNGFLFSDIGNENTVITEGVHFIKTLSDNPELLQAISDNNIDYAYQTFSMDRFNEHYRKLFQEVRA